MSFLKDIRGFTITELMAAVVVLTIGLTGVAAMQMTALNGTFVANGKSTGSGIALAWTEWLNGLMSHADQDKIFDSNTGMWTRENVFRLASLDPGQNDQSYVEIVLPLAINDIVACFNGQQAFVLSTGGTKTVAFRKEGGTLFTAKDLPPPAPAGAKLVLRIAANVPVVNTASVDIAVPYKNAFAKGLGATLHFVVSSNM
jgi:prepilin-type N-terminal cleavage/methylation domain-containing protein